MTATFDFPVRGGGHGGGFSQSGHSSSHGGFSHAAHHASHAGRMGHAHGGLGRTIGHTAVRAGVWDTVGHFLPAIGFGLVAVLLIAALAFWYFKKHTHKTADNHA